jgi:hypothetical protein
MKRDFELCTMRFHTHTFAFMLTLSTLTPSGTSQHPGKQSRQIRTTTPVRFFQFALEFQL